LPHHLPCAVRLVRKLLLEGVELGAALRAPLDEDVLVEAGLGLERQARRPVEQPLWLVCRQVREHEAQVVGIVAAGFPVTGAGEGVDVALAEGRGLERDRVALEVALGDRELGDRPITAKPMGFPAARGLPRHA